MPKLGRNDPCPCGSGKKYKKCCRRLRIDDPNKVLSRTDHPELLQEHRRLMEEFERRKKERAAKYGYVRPIRANALSPSVAHSNGRNPGRLFPTSSLTTSRPRWAPSGETLRSRNLSRSDIQFSSGTTVCADYRGHTLEVRMLMRMASTTAKRTAPRRPTISSRMTYTSWPTT